MYHSDRECFICGRNGTQDPKGLEEHHIFNGAGLRKKCEKYGLTVWLCGWEHHNGGENSVHMNQDVDRRIKQYGQRKAMEENGWTVQDFIFEFGKNYLSDEEEETAEEPEAESPWAEIEALAEKLAEKKRAQMERERIRNVPEDCFSGMA